MWTTFSLSDSKHYQQLLNLNCCDLGVDECVCKMLDFKLCNIHSCNNHACFGLRILLTVNLYLPLKWIYLLYDIFFKTYISQRHFDNQAPFLFSTILPIQRLYSIMRQYPDIGPDCPKALGIHSYCRHLLF